MSGSRHTYDRIGTRYAQRRQADPRIGALVERALAGARSVVNVGAGTGSYEPTHARVVAVEPSETMLRQRARLDAAVRAVAEALPFRAGSFDAAMAVLSLHHWTDPLRGLREMRRVASSVVVLTYEPSIHDTFWLFTEYFGAVREVLARQNTPSVEVVADVLGAREILTVPIPHDCVDGFGWAYWRRPEAYLDPDVRACVSALALLDEDEVRAGIEALERDLASGAWSARHADLLDRSTIDGGFRLVVA